MTAKRKLPCADSIEMRATPCNDCGRAEECRLIRETVTAKQVWRREELTREDEGPCGFALTVCNLCGGESLEAETVTLIAHDRDCPLANPDVLGVSVLTMTNIICEACPARDRPCVVPDWSLETHETLLASCGRYAVENGRRL